MLSPSAKERLRTLTVEALLEVRRAYLQTSQANVLKHWNLLQDRALASARMASGPEEWASLVAKALKLDAPSSSYSRSLLELTHAVHEMQCAPEWLDLVERETAFLMVMTRRIAEQRADERKEAANAV